MNWQTSWAKKGTNIVQKPTSNLPYNSVKQLIHHKFTTHYKAEQAKQAEGKKWGNLIEKPDIIPQRPCKTAVAAFRLHTGHDCLASHLYKIGMASSPICTLCDRGEEMNELHLKTCTALPQKDNIFQKYWRARILMASSPNV